MPGTALSAETKWWTKYTKEGLEDYRVAVAFHGAMKWE